jgi:hypothetical protein
MPFLWDLGTEKKNGKRKKKKRLKRVGREKKKLTDGTCENLQKKPQK